MPFTLIFSCFKPTIFTTISYCILTSLVQKTIHEYVIKYHSFSYKMHQSQLVMENNKIIFIISKFSIAFFTHLKIYYVCYMIDSCLWFLLFQGLFFQCYTFLYFCSFLYFFYIPNHSQWFLLFIRSHIMWLTCLSLILYLFISLSLQCILPKSAR